MVRNEETYQQAVEFRKRGFTYSEIAKICGVSKSTVSAWLSKQAFSKRVKADNIEKAARDNKKRIALLNKARTTERTARYAEAKRSAETEFRHYKKDSLFMAGLMLYVGAGDRTDVRQIRLASAQLDIHQLFVRFAREYLGVEKTAIHFWLLLYPDLDEAKCMRVWSRKLGISPAQFYKNQVIQGKHKKQVLHYGVGNTIIGNTVLKQKLNRWIELATKELTTK